MFRENLIYFCLVFLNFTLTKVYILLVNVYIVEDINNLIMQSLHFFKNAIFYI